MSIVTIIGWATISFFVLVFFLIIASYIHGIPRAYRVTSQMIKALPPTVKPTESFFSWYGNIMWYFVKEVFMVSRYTTITVNGTVINWDGTLGKPFHGA